MIPVRRQVAVRLILSLAICIGISFSMPVFLDRHELATAVVALMKNPSPATQAAFEEQRRENDKAMLLFHTSAAVLLFVVFNAAWVGVSAAAGIFRKRSQDSPAL